MGSDHRPSAYQADALPLSYARWLARVDSNHRPPPSQRGILPLNYGPRFLLAYGVVKVEGGPNAATPGGIPGVAGVGVGVGIWTLSALRPAQRPRIDREAPAMRWNALELAKGSGAHALTITYRQIIVNSKSGFRRKTWKMTVLQLSSMILRGAFQAMSTDRLPLPDILRGLILSAGLSHQEAALRSGISPGAVAMICARTPKPLLGWLRLASALGCRLIVSTPERTWPVAMPGTPRAIIERAWLSWRTRRVVTTINHLRAADPRLTRTVLDERARGYAANEEARLRARLLEVRATIGTLGGSLRAAGLRSGLRQLTDKLGLKAEELTLLAGASLSACQFALGESQDGRLGTVHRLCSALGVRLELHFARGLLCIGLCPPGDWRPGSAENEDDGDGVECPDEKPPGAVRGARDNQNRSRLASDDLLKLYDEGVSIGEIARRAGVSRQRVHKLAMDNGRSQRRQLQRAQRVADGRGLLQLG